MLSTVTAREEKARKEDELSVSANEEHTIRYASLPWRVTDTTDIAAKWRPVQLPGQTAARTWLRGNG